MRIWTPLGSWMLGLTGVAGVIATSCVVLAAPGDGPHSSAEAPQANVKASLVSGSSAIAPGQPVEIALEFYIRPGWHTYWRNPGDSGEATQLLWDLPRGFSASEISWERPHRFEIPPLVNYGYDRHVMHLVSITVPPNLKVGTRVTLEAKADWLVCSNVCIPESAVLHLDLPVAATATAAPPQIAQRFAAAHERLPQRSLAPTHARVSAGQLELRFDPAWTAALGGEKSVYFFPYAAGAIDYPAPQSLAASPDGSLRLTVKAGYAAPKRGPVEGIIVATPRASAGESAAAASDGGASEDANAARAWEIAAGLDAAPVSASVPSPGAASTVSSSLPGLMLSAVLGGLILNLMPCVFPVLSIKAVGLVEQARHDPRKVRAKGLVFAAGVIASMLVLAATLLILRAGGQQIGWGFQLQSPLFVTLMAYLLLAVGLNLSGVFEFGGGLAGAGDALTQGEGLRASFFTGVLTTLVATPCSAPYMAAAVGAALTQSALHALVIFIALGLGLSLPYISLCFAPGLRKLLPKPGAWMDTLKQLFAFPMYASAAWLLWVLAQQTGPYALAAAFAGCVLVALSAWAFQKSQHNTRGARWIATVSAVLSLGLAIYLPWRSAADAAPVGTSSVRATSTSADDWRIYEPAKLASARAAGTPVLVNFTASWCLTCLVNERTVFGDSAVQEVFRRKGVLLMKGDWTNRDPVITAALTSFGRAGVPLYLAYNSKPGHSDPVILPQLLTAGLIRETFALLPDR